MKKVNKREANVKRPKEEPKRNSRQNQGEKQE